MKNIMAENKRQLDQKISASLDQTSGKKGFGQKSAKVKHASSGTEDSGQAKGRNFLATVNFLLVLACIGFLGLIFYKYYGQAQQTSDVALTDKMPLPAMESENLFEAMQRQPFSNYRDLINRRNAFLAPWEQPKDDQSGEVISQAVDLSKELTLVGIVLDEEPKAIIESLKDKETYFLQVGETVNGATLMSIEEQKVILDFNGTKVELSY